MSKTTWLYCVTLTRTADEDLFEVREVYTDRDGALSWTAEPATPQADTWLGLFDDLDLMTKATFATQVLDITDPDKPEWKPRSLRPAARSL